MKTSEFLFSIDEREKQRILLYRGEPLGETYFFEQAQRVLANHVIPKRDELHYYKSLFYALANFNIDLQKPRKLLEELALKGCTVDELKDPDFVRETWETINFRFKEDRTTSAIEYACAYPEHPDQGFLEGKKDGMEQLVQDFFADPFVTRRKLAHDDGIKWMRHKIASLWYLCLGGTEFMVLDKHNFRQLKGLGMDIPEEYYIGKKRGEGVTETQVHATQPSARKYEALEAEAIALLREFPEFITPQGTFNAALATAVFWWGGVQSSRSIIPQRPLLEEAVEEPFPSPYSTND